MLFLAALSAFVSSAEAQTANTMLSACKRFINNEANGGLVGVYEQGMCVGILTGVFSASKKICPPKGVTGGQITRIVIARLEKVPQFHHLEFARLAEEILASTWPCKN